MYTHTHTQPLWRVVLYVFTLCASREDCVCTEMNARTHSLSFTLPRPSQCSCVIIRVTAARRDANLKPTCHWQRHWRDAWQTSTAVTNERGAVCIHVVREP